VDSHNTVVSKLQKHLFEVSGILQRGCGGEGRDVGGQISLDRR
jgi:hypothetical protein